MFYRHMGELPHKRHVQFRKKDGALYREQVMGTKGFSGTQSILYHHYMPTEVGHAAVSHSCQLQYEEDVVLHIVIFARKKIKNGRCSKRKKFYAWE